MEEQSQNNDIQGQDFTATMESEFNPLAEPVIEREYTGSNNVGGGTPAVEDVQFTETTKDPNHRLANNAVPESSIPEPDYMEQSIPEPSYNPNPNMGADNMGGGNDYYEETEPEPQMTDKEKRKNARETAKIFIAMYAQLRKLPFEAWGKISEKKVNGLSLANEINLNMALANGQTVAEFINTHNRTLEQALVFDPDVKENIENALVDVLLEQGVELSPTNRLMIAVGMDLIGLIQTTKTYADIAKEALGTFQERHFEARGGARNANQSQPQSQSQSQPSSPSPDVSDYINDPNIEIIEEE